MRTRALTFMIVCTLVACASSSPQSCPSGTCEIDAGVSDATSTFDAGPDGPPLQGFGEGCTTNAQCESNLCILVGTSGQCTQLCGDCPDSYGCLGVEGIVLEGTVSFVCVPTSNQLCTTCTEDTECTLIGMDKCVTYPDGDRACARDCSGVSCPVGYDCETVNIGGSNFQQCMATSGACDCTASNPGAMQECTIPTPWNMCLGAQTCNGALGWGGCDPPSLNDDPDAGFVDSNCDGLDGDRARAIFVSVAGVNAATCGLVYSDPCQTIGFGIARAVASSRPHVYVQNGTYNASITMVDGVSVFGGYNFNWARAPYSTAGHTVTIVGGVTAVRFDSLASPTWLDDVVVRSADATGAGASSIGILITSSQAVELRGVQVIPGVGMAGTPGTDGSVGTDGSDGGDGKPGVEGSTAFGCDNRAIPARGVA
ncbi:MAG: hypothetical protein H0T79_02725, partial [Deltaproteobacteria bacterium]|nr:hypothetical protein [Deltaproteobacteria bacterium]